jgi:DNA-binding MarR family transcriptional regulator
MHQTIARTAGPRPAGHQPADVNPLELQVLRAIERLDGAPMDAIPTRWPLIRMHVPAAVDRLVAAGLVAVAPTVETGGAVTLTDRGRRLLHASAL